MNTNNSVDQLTDNGELLPYEWPGSYFIGEEEEQAALDVLRHRSPYRYYGHDLQRYAERLEAAYCERLNRQHAVAVNSGTAALSIAFSAIGVGPGDEILLPGYMWVSCISSIVRTGAIPRLVDIDDTFCMDPDDLRRKISSRSRAVLLVHMSGAPGAIDRVAKICKEQDLYLIEDCAQANGARFDGKPVGSFGDLAIFSFQLNKNITAGEGGILVCDDEQLYRRAWACHDMGYARNIEGRLDPSDPKCQLWGHGSRCAEMIAAVVLAQLPKLDTITSLMRQRKYRLREKLADIPGLGFRRILDPVGDSGPFLLLIWKDRETCLEVVRLTREAGVRTGPSGINNIPMTDWGLHLYYNNLSLVNKSSISATSRPWSDPLNAFAREYEYQRGALPVMDGLIDRSSLLSIPPMLPLESVDKVAQAFTSAVADIRASLV
jgi:dTDP-4-amino-4,6-dideoxygalactose transaminase